jgi:hypothetical protein
MFESWKDFLRNKDGSWAWDKLVAVFVSLTGVAGGAGTFYYKEIYTPSAVPVNVSMALDIQRLPQRPIQAGPIMIPVQLSAAAKNESNRILKINKTHWVAYARSLSGDLVTQADFIADVNSQMALGDTSLNLKDGASSRFQKSIERWDPVGFGPLFDNNEIRPKEEIRAQRLIYVPAHAVESEGASNKASLYQMLRVKVSIPTYAKTTLADEDLVRVFGGFLRGGTEYVGVYFCQAERTFRENKLRWWFDKFLLPRDSLEDNYFRGPEVRYCPTPLTQAEREQIKAQVFVSSYEIDLTQSSVAPVKKEAK